MDYVRGHRGNEGRGALAMGPLNEGLCLGVERQWVCALAALVSCGVRRARMMVRVWASASGSSQM